MKSDHRHELKSNELAEWLGNLPQWSKENFVIIVVVVALVVAAGAVYGWWLYSKNVVQARQRTEFTNLLNQVSSGKMQILQGRQSQGRDFSFVLLQPANSLRSFAEEISSERMAALALIKRAEALRAELHYGNVEEQYLNNQIDLAKESYAEAFDKTTNRPLKASAKFGLGLCEEELGRFEQARAIYQEIAGNADYKNTLAAVRAKRRLETMADYQKEIAFEPAPAPEAATEAVSTDTGELPSIIQPFNIYRSLQFDMLNVPNEPAEANLPVDANVSGQ